MSNMQLSLFTVPIAILSSAFFDKLQKYSFKGDINEFDMNEKDRDEYKYKYYLSSIIISVVGLIVASLLMRKYKHMALGIAIGSLIHLFRAVFYNWNTFKEDIKLIVLALSLGIMIFASYAHSNNMMPF